MSDCGASDAGDQLHILSGAHSHPRVPYPAPSEEKNLFLPGSIQAASPELNPSLLQSVQYQILQKVEYRKKCVTDMENLHRSKSWDYFAAKLN